MDQQARVNRMLGRGVTFSILWLGGLGSAFAIYDGIMVRRLIKLNPSLKGWAARGGALSLEEPGS
jgi:hypothetical protein